MKREGLLRRLRRYVCVLRREGKEHTLWENPQTGHGGIPNNLAKTICRKLTIPDPPGYGLAAASSAPQTARSPSRTHASRVNAPITKMEVRAEAATMPLTLHCAPVGSDTSAPAARGTITRFPAADTP